MPGDALHDLDRSRVRTSGRMLLDDRVGDGIALVLELAEQLVCPARARRPCRESLQGGARDASELPRTDRDQVEPVLENRPRGARDADVQLGGSDRGGGRSCAGSAGADHRRADVDLRGARGSGEPAWPRGWRRRASARAITSVATCSTAPSTSRRCSPRTSCGPSRSTSTTATSRTSCATCSAMPTSRRSSTMPSSRRASKRSATGCRC